MLIINWATGAQSCHSPRLHLILEEVLLLKHNFDFISICMSTRSATNWQAAYPKKAWSYRKVKSR